MQYTKLGQSDLTVSRICMGCMGFGDVATGQHSWTIGEDESREIIRYGLESAYQPHNLVGIMAQNTPATKDNKQVWSR